MISRLSFTISNKAHCRPYGHLGKGIALFAVEGMYLFIGDQSIFSALACWLNPEQIIQTGGANVS